MLQTTSLTLTGGANITITNAVVATINLATVDASSMSAAVDVDANSAVVVTMTGKGGDTLEGGIRADIINGGDGTIHLLVTRLPTLLTVVLVQIT